MPEISFTILVIIYVFLLVWMLSGLNRTFVKNNSVQPFISVVIAARNEEKNIVPCLQSVFNQSYPTDKYEVIIAEDYSEDSTGELIDKFIIDKSTFQKIIPESLNGLTGKSNALFSAINRAKGEVLMFTDADCQVPVHWIQNTVQYFNSSAGMVNGFSITENETLLGKIQSLDLIFLISTAAGMSNNGSPVSCIGNNMSVRTDIYKNTKGYKSFGNSLTEDYSLLNEVKKAGNCEIVFPLDSTTVVQTRALESISELMAQKKRWAVGGLSNINKSIFLLIIAYLTNFYLLFSMFFLSPLLVITIAAKMFSEYLFLSAAAEKLDQKDCLKVFPLFQIYYIFYSLIIPFIILFRGRVTWKGRKY